MVDPPWESHHPGNQSFYHQMFTKQQVAMLMIDPPTLAIVDANQTSAQFYGYDVATLKQLMVSDLVVSSEGQSLPAEQLNRWMDDRQSTWHHRLASGVICHVEVIANTVVLNEDEYLVWIVQDISERQQIEQALQEKHDQERLIQIITDHIRQTLNLNSILQTTVNEVQNFLHSDRVAIGRFRSSNYCTIIAEACHPDYTPMLGWKLGNIEANELSQSSWVPTPPAIAGSQTDADSTYRQLLQAFDVQAQLLVPIYQGELLWGILMVHQCRAYRQWQTWEIDFLTQIESQLAVAIQQAELLQQVRELNELLEAKVEDRTAQLLQVLDYELLTQRITAKVRDSLDEDQILQSVVEELGQTLQLLRCNTCLYNSTFTQLQVSHTFYRFAPPPPLEALEVIYLIESYPQLLQEQLSQFCPLPPTALPWFNQEQMVLIVPICDSHEMMGILWLERDQSEWFDDREVQLVQQVSAQCAIAIRQSRLYQAAQYQVEELERLNQLKGDFLNTVSHELRTPLSSIKLSSQLLELMLRQLNIIPSPGEAVGVTKKIEQCLRVLKEECDREIELINDILTLQQLDAGTQPYIPSTIQLQQWIPQIVDVFGEQMQTQQQHLEIQIPDDLPAITTDLNMFDHALGELLTNACKFTPNGGTITVKAASILEPTTAAHPSQHIIQIQVINTGITIPVAEQAKIFQVFYRIPSNDPWRYGGTGMGLALVQRLIKHLGGTIQVYSEAGQTCFTIRLPLILQSSPQHSPMQSVR